MFTFPYRRPSTSINERVFKRAKAWDTAARYLIVTGGILVIICVIGILFLIASVSLPLFLPPGQEILARFQVKQHGSDGFLSAAMDEYLETGSFLDKRGLWHFYDLKEGTILLQKQSQPPTDTALRIQNVEFYGQNLFSLVWQDHSASVLQVQFIPQFTEKGRHTIHDLLEVASFPANGKGIPLKTLARASLPEDDEPRHTLVQLFPRNRIEITQRIVEEDFLGNQQTESYTASLQETPSGNFTFFTMDGASRNLYAATDQGELWHWSLEEPGEPVLLQNFTAFRNKRNITALNLVFGDISLAVGDKKGQVTTWFLVPDPQNETRKILQRAHTLPSHSSPVIQLIPSRVDKSLLSLDEEGIIHWDHTTTERQLLRFEAEVLPNRSKDSVTEQRIKIFNTAPRGNGLLAMDARNLVTLWKVKNPHPEISWKTLFGKVLYEDYPAPDYVWQSSSASDDFEPKFSLVPLIFGSFKGTFYAMFLAIPLALFGAIYTSQFANESFRRFIKPGVEVMAAMPSVIIGFMIALWLAPIVEDYVLAFFLSLFFIPLATLLFVAAWFLVRHQNWAKWIEAKGYEFLLLIPVIIVACLATLPFQELAQQIFFAGDFNQWLFNELGVRYEQRNSVIIAFGLGFMVIPIIFTISEDALTNVPASLKYASLALGASRWQTVWRIVIPSASPGIFAACIIGFGRAAGETMVVLMATGNTPILDWSILNGMRTLAANIAVELPEAPVDGTLYRILFLSAVVLFLLTSILNTIAEIIRQRLRKKYGQFQ